MQDRLLSLPKDAKDKAIETKKFFNKLKKRAPKNLDNLVEEIHDDVFEKTDCLSCENCCKTTGPLFLKQDIARISKVIGLKPAQFEKKYLRIDEDNDWVLQKVPCSFLGADDACTIYDVRPKACQEFPHTNQKKIYKITDLTIKNTSICPAAFDVVERMKASIKL